MHSVLVAPVICMSEQHAISHLQEEHHTGMNLINGMCPGMNGLGKRTQLGLMVLDMLLLRT